MEGIPTLRDGMVAPILRTSLHRGGEPERVERIDKVQDSSRGDDQEGQNSQSERDETSKVTLLHSESDELGNESEVPAMEGSTASQSEKIRAWADRVEFEARNIAAKNAIGSRQSGLVGRDSPAASGNPYECVTVSN